jgi:hypothetical protein
MSTQVVYTPPTEVDCEDDTIVNEIVKGSEVFGKTFSNREFILADGTGLSFKTQPVDTNNTWSTLGVRAFGTFCDSIVNVVTYVREQMPSINGLADYNKDNVLTLSVSFKFE